VTKQYGVSVVGLIHSRGVAGVMSGGVFPFLQAKMPDLEADFCCQSLYGINCDGIGSLEGVSGLAQRGEF